MTEWNPDLLSPLSHDDSLQVYYWMRLTRAFDDRMVAMWKQGRGLGGAFSERGHEAVAVGAGFALGPDDVVAPMHRDLGCYLVRGMSPARIFGNLLGKETGVTRDVTPICMVLATSRSASSGS